MRKIIFIILLVFISSCSYKWSYLTRKTPKNIRSIAIPLIENDTYKNNIEVPLTNELRRAFAKRGMISVVSSSSQADAVFYGRITGYEEENIVIKNAEATLQTVKNTSQFKPSQSLIKIKVGGAIIDRHDGGNIWEGEKYAQSRYAATAEALDIDLSINMAVKDIAQKIAKQIEDDVVNQF